ncbi:MAG: hypothetical protein QM564_11855 [Bergeyella sp.]
MMKIFKNIFLILFLIGVSLSVKAQNQDHNHDDEKWTEEKTIPFETKYSYPMADDIKWELVNLKNSKIIAKGNGSIKDFSFKKPGQYELHIFEEIHHVEGGCNHPNYPSKIMITAGSEKMEFDFSTIQFSRKIKAGEDMMGATLTVNVNVSSAGKKSTVYNKELKTVGIGTSIKGKLKGGEVKLRNGVNTLVYELEGKATKDTYIMFIFTDSNALEQSYSLMEKIQ